MRSSDFRWFDPVTLSSLSWWGQCLPTPCLLPSCVPWAVQRRGGAEERKWGRVLPIYHVETSVSKAANFFVPVSSFRMVSLGLSPPSLDLAFLHLSAERLLVCPNLQIAAEGSPKCHCWKCAEWLCVVIFGVVRTVCLSIHDGPLALCKHSTTTVQLSLG